MSLRSLLEKLNALVLFALFCITAAAVVFRTILGIPASWSEELGQYAFIFLVFIGAAAVTADDGHISITSFVDRLGPGGRRTCRLLQLALPILFLVVFAWGAWTNVRSNWGMELSTVTWMNVGYMYLCLMLSSIVMIGYLLRLLVRAWRAPPPPPSHPPIDVGSTP
jgi:TRAP-type C4-dicarboxylate transport system permease small subunit